MKIAVLSDIHANLAALQAVLGHMEALAPDAVMVGGDIINRGPQPRECLELILEKAQAAGTWNIIRGNHEDYALRACAGISHLPAWEQKVVAHTSWTVDRIRDYLDVIASWPDQAEIVAPDGSSVVCLHASRKGNRVGLYEHMDDEVLLEHAHPVARVLCVGHTHIPFTREIEGKLIVNAGAVGMPFDRNPDASYACIEWTPGGWNVEIIRIPYERSRTEQAYRSSGYLEEGGPMIPLIIRELQHAAPYLGRWHHLYEARVVRGEMTVEDSVQEMLDKHSLIDSHR